jgi:catechol 2,3-dioxygenase-like lactoylglutathione lyase family enzyme
MAIVGIESLVYGVEDIPTSTRFFEDFGLPLVESNVSGSVFVLPEGSSVLIRSRHDSSLPNSSIEGTGVREVIWGLDSQKSLDALATDLASDRDIIRDPDGTVHFLTDFGNAMGLRVFAKRPVLTAPDPLNSPGCVNRLNQHRKWRLRAFPKVLSHVVFSVPQYQAAAQFMCKRLKFKLSDSQRGFGEYLRADGSNNHHSLLLLNAAAPIPGMDGKHRFHHANFGVEDIDEIMIGANYMTRCGWEPSHFGLGRHRVDSALFYYLPCPAGGEAEYGADADYLDDGWVPREFVEPLFAYSHFVHNLPPFLSKNPAWNFSYLTGIATTTAKEDER